MESAMVVTQINKDVLKPKCCRLETIDKTCCNKLYFERVF